MPDVKITGQWRCLFSLGFFCLEVGFSFSFSFCTTGRRHCCDKSTVIGKESWVIRKQLE